jgi:hypothetical protein
LSQGTVTVFNSSKEYLADGTFDLDTHVFKIALVSDSSLVATQADLALATGFTEVSGGTSYVAGGITLTCTWVESGGTVTFDSSTTPSWSQDASGPVDIRYGIIYDDTEASDTALAYVDMTTGGDGTTAISLQTGDISVTWSGSGIFTLA